MRILIVEDDAAMARLTATGLEDLGHDVTWLGSGDAGMMAALAAPFDVIVLDRMLPDRGGVEILRHWRTHGMRAPVLMLTAMGAIDDRVTGLEAGADDYLVKPFAFAELAARVAALVRRQAPDETPTRFTAGDITLDLLRREVRRGGRTIHLQPREFALLEQLMRHAGRTVTRAMFLESVWGFHFDPQTNIVESHLSRMRTKLNDGFARDPIETLRGIGYRLRA